MLLNERYVFTNLVVIAWQASSSLCNASSTQFVRCFNSTCLLRLPRASERGRFPPPLMAPRWYGAAYVMTVL